MKRYKSMLFTVVFLCLFASTAYAENHWEWKFDQADGQATVGKMAHFSGRLLQNGQAPQQPLDIVITAFSKETGAIIFQTKTLSKTGAFQFLFQFYDGSPHQIRLEAFYHGQNQAIASVVKEVEVTAIEPPMDTKIKSFLFFMLVVFFAMMAGVALAKWRQKRWVNKMA
ncbi:hypothetical protein [Thermoflavimicrobium dichotomicum]|uniref:Carboxypeptidase regulatory-like domain-containing protein n=1 Tax=Thermoflavimicrobium dichotomicum TaxID=46223 RepID=A0A1I3PKE0_9BACL|nr:hypothetical protein [Thermoflavimicrobium dichotomicum]SFJ21821.1 hypothetical protein SAMN05421852_1063 [Thermoflavimicrobium dichotomicum]